MILDLLKSKISTQFYKFIIVGLWSTIVNYGVFYILLAFFGTHYLIASAMGFMAGVFAGYGFNRKWTFRVVSAKTQTEILQYYAVYIVSMLLSLLFLRLVVGTIGVDPKIANILSIGLTTCTNFIGVKIIVFR